MKTLLFTKELEDLKTEALVVGFYESFGNSDIDKYDVISDGLVNEVIKSKEFTGKFGKVLMLRLKGKLKRLVLVGLGKREEFGLDKAREISGKAAVYVRDQGIGEFSIVLFDDIKKVDQFTLVANGNNFVEIDNAIRKALVITDAVYYVRDLQNKPSNVVTPSYLAEEAKRIAARFKFKCTVLETKDMKKLGMGGMLAVSRGSDHLPKFIIFEYNGGKETFCFVGKGITFDSGGISLKPSQDMDDMKFDMSGGAVIFGLMIAVSQLKLPYRVVGLVPATENLPGGNAYKPGDIIKFHNGKTAEIINTDAEGRLVLGDALAYSKRFNPNAVIDFATLTGACVVSLGNLYAGLFSNSDEFSSKLVKAGENSGELIWRMPLHDKYKEHVKSNVADIKNSGSRDAGAITAAVFLKEFVECKKWAHIDIAGTAYTKNNKDVLSPYGGTGFGVRLIMKLLEDWKTK